MIGDYRVFPGAIPKEVCNHILASAEWDKEYEGQVFIEGQGITRPESRITKITWADKMSVIGCIAQTYLLNINALSGWNFHLGMMENIQIGKYEEGGHYNWHIDLGNPDANGQMRKLSFAVLLNDPAEFDGGQLEFDGVTQQPEQGQGTIVIFPSYVTHRVTPVTRGVRYSAVTWVNGPAFR